LGARTKKVWTIRRAGLARSVPIGPDATASPMSAFSKPASQKRPSLNPQFSRTGVLSETRVESRTGAVTVVSRWLIDLAFASSPQSGLASSCFLFPLIEPDWQLSRIRLSEKTHAFAHGRFAVRCGNWTKPYTEFRDASGKRLYPGRGSLCLSHNHRRSLLWACISTAL